MNILVVGNGFDLAHGLPTKYSDFLDFITLYITKYHPDWVRWGLVDDNDNDESKWKNRRWSFYHTVLESLKSDVSAQTKSYLTNTATISMPYLQAKTRLKISNAIAFCATVSTNIPTKKLSIEILVGLTLKTRFKDSYSLWSRRLRRSRN